MANPTSEEVLRALGLVPHPEGGYYAETFRDAQPGERGASTAIYFVLKAGQRSHWHKVDASEVFHHYSGARVEIRTWRPGEVVLTQTLGRDLVRGERPQIVVEAGLWQSAALVQDEECDYALMGCTVAPAFEFEGFELAPPGWEPS